MTKARELDISKPEEQELARKLEEQARVESDLAERELVLTNLRAEMAAFEQDYLREVGILYSELDELKAQLAERLAQEQPGNERAQEAARQARRRAEETSIVAGANTQGPRKPFTPTQELKRLFRDVARRIHPDLTADPDDHARRQKLMAEANRAYANGDKKRLKKILAEYEHAPELVSGEGTGADLVRVIRRISQAKNRLAEIEAETDQMLRSDVFQLSSRLEQAKEFGRDITREMREKVKQQIAEAREKLKAPRGASH